MDMRTADDKVLPITQNVNWIGILDRSIVTFDVVMETQHGTTYNSYFIQAGKKVVIDTAKENYKDAYLAKVRQVTDPADIDYIVINHTEPDHSGNVRHLLNLSPKAIVYGSRQALNYLGEMIGKPFASVAVKDGDTLDLGGKTLRFISAPNLHWPDSIYTYLEEDKLLFTCDSFGAHFCDEKMFDDLIGDYSGAFKYYFDVILRPFSKFYAKAIEKIEPLEIAAICPGHGPILRTTHNEVVTRTRQYVNDYLAESSPAQKNILVTYVSAYGYTKKMAGLIASGISEVTTGQVFVVDIENMLLGELEEYIVKSQAILIGSPTINQNTLLPVYKMFSLLNPLRDKGKKAAAFGSYGWSGEAVRLIENHLAALKLDVICEGASTKFLPNTEESDQLVEFGRRFARSLNATITNET